MKKPVYIVIGPTASGKTARAIEIAKREHGEIISVDSRQVYRMLDIGTEKITKEEMQGIPHHLIDIRNPEEVYSAGDFVEDATRLINDIHERGKTAILAGGTHFYIDALLYGLPEAPVRNDALRQELEEIPSEELYAQVQQKDPIRAEALDPKNKRRLVRALEILATESIVPKRAEKSDFLNTYDVHFEVINPEREVLRERIDTRLMETLKKGLVDETSKVREYLTKKYHSEEIADKRLAEFGLEYKVAAQVLRGEIQESDLFPTLSAKLWQLARRQKSWIKKLSVACSS